jgi:hypothetical protein
MLFYFVFISTVKPTVPIFYVNSNKLDGLPYRREDYQHQCFGNVGKPAGQLVIEFHLLPGILAFHVLSPLLSSLEKSNFENYHSQYYG